MTAESLSPIDAVFSPQGFHLQPHLLTGKTVALAFFDCLISTLHVYSDMHPSNDIHLARQLFKHRLLTYGQRVFSFNSSKVS